MLLKHPKPVMANSQEWQPAIWQPGSNANYDGCSGAQKRILGVCLHHNVFLNFVMHDIFFIVVAQPSWPLIQGNPFHHTIVNMFCLHHHLYHLFSLGAKSPCNAAFVATWVLHYSHHGHSDSAMFSFHVWQSWWPLFAKQCHIIHEICHQKFWPHLIALQVGFHCIHVAPFWPFRSLPQWES